MKQNNPFFNTCVSISLCCRPGAVWCSSFPCLSANCALCGGTEWFGHTSCEADCPSCHSGARGGRVSPALVEGNPRWRRSDWPLPLLNWPITNFCSSAMACSARRFAERCWLEVMVLLHKFARQGANKQIMITKLGNQLLLQNAS